MRVTLGGAHAKTGPPAPQIGRSRPHLGRPGGRHLWPAGDLLLLLFFPGRPLRLRRLSHRLALVRRAGGAKPGLLCRGGGLPAAGHGPPGAAPLGIKADPAGALVLAGRRPAAGGARRAARPGRSPARRQPRAAAGAGGGRWTGRADRAGGAARAGALALPHRPGAGRLCAERPAPHLDRAHPPARAGASAALRHHDRRAARGDFLPGALSALWRAADRPAGDVLDRRLRGGARRAHLWYGAAGKVGLVGLAGLCLTAGRLGDPLVCRPALARCGPAPQPAGVRARIPRQDACAARSAAGRAGRHSAAGRLAGW